MREVKFRGKRIDNGEWAYGYIVKTFTGRCFIITGNDECFRENTWSANPKHEDFVTSEFYEVDERTVGQYTGLKDKNGKEVYEGDIIRLTIRHYTDCGRTELTNEETITQMVVFEYHTFGFTDGKGIKPFIWILGLDKHIEVIGNIHNNPELLSN